MAKYYSPPKYEKPKIGKRSRKAPDYLTNFKITPDLYHRMVVYYSEKSREELINISKDPDTPIIDLMVISVMVKCVSNGDFSRLNFFLDRIIGKVPDKQISETTMVFEARIGEGGNVIPAVQEIIDIGEVEDDANNGN